MDKIYVTRSSMPPYEEFTEMIRPLWETRRLTNMGMYHEELENRLRDKLGVPYLSLMVNGHMALELAIQALGLPEGGEVITTPFTFISTTHAIVRNRLKPVFCDIKPDDYTLDEEKLEGLITDRTAAILPVHVYGNVCNVERMQEIADRHGLKVIYDACHAFGETYKGRGVGCFGDVSVFSFHATKVYHTMEGGAVAFAEERLYEKLYNLKNFGIQGEELITDVGANAKMNELAAIMGLCNLREIDRNIALRRERVQLYNELLGHTEGLRLPAYDRADIQYNYGYYPVLFADKESRDRIYDRLREKNIYARKYFYPLTADAECFQGKYSLSELRNARQVSDRVLVLPLYPELEYDVMVYIVEIIKRDLAKRQRQVQTGIKALI